MCHCKQSVLQLFDGMVVATSRQSMLPRSTKDWSDDDAIDELQKQTQRTSTRKEEHAARTEKLRQAISNIRTRRTRRQMLLRPAPDAAEGDPSGGPDAGQASDDDYKPSANDDGKEDKPSSSTEAETDNSRSQRPRRQSGSRVGAQEAPKSTAPRGRASAATAKRRAPAMRSSARLRSRKEALADTLVTPPPHKRQRRESPPTEESPQSAGVPQRSLPARPRRSRPTLRSSKPKPKFVDAGVVSSEDDAADGMSDFIADSEEEAEEGLAAAQPAAWGSSAERGAASGAASGADKQPSGSAPTTGRCTGAVATRPAGSGDEKHQRASPEPDELEVAEEGLPPGSMRRLRKVGSEAAATPSGAAGATLEEEAGPSSTGRRASTRPRVARRDPLERILAHQAAVTRGDSTPERRALLQELEGAEDGDAPVPATSDSDGSSGDQVVQLSDSPAEVRCEGAGAPAGEQRAAAGSSDAEGSELGSFIVRDDPAEAAQGEVDVSSPLARLGLFRPLRAPELEECFHLYLDYLLFSLADPGFEDMVEENPEQRRSYMAALRRVEEGELGRWREHYAKSDAWKRALPGFVPALEALPGLSVEAGVCAGDLMCAAEAYLQNNDDDDGGERECAACKRLHSRATVQLVFRGVPYEPDYRFGTKRLAGMAIRADDTDKELEDSDGQVKERAFVVGRLCAVRVQLYHVLWHYKHKLRATLKKALRKARAALKTAGQPYAWMEAADAVRGDAALYQRLFKNFARLGNSAQKYAQSNAGGSWAHAHSALRKTTDEVARLIYTLNSDSDGDAGSELKSSSDAGDGEPYSSSDAAPEDVEDAMPTGRAGLQDKRGDSGSAIGDAEGGPRACAEHPGGPEPQDSGPLGSDAELQVFAAETPVLDSPAATRPSDARQAARACAGRAADVVLAASPGSGKAPAGTCSGAEPSADHRVRQPGSMRRRAVLDSSDDDEDEGAGAGTRAPLRANIPEAPTKLGDGPVRQLAGGSVRRSVAQHKGTDDSPHPAAVEPAGTLDDDDDDIVWEPCRACSGSGKLRRCAAATRRSLQQEGCQQQQQQQGAHGGHEEVSSGVSAPCALPCDVPAAAPGTPVDRGLEPLAAGRGNKSSVPGAAVDLTRDPDLADAAATAGCASAEGTNHLAATHLPAPHIGAANQAKQPPVSSTSQEQSATGHGSPVGLPPPAMAGSMVVTGKRAECPVSTLPRSPLGSNTQKSTPGSVPRQVGIRAYFSPRGVSQ